MLNGLWPNDFSTVLEFPQEIWDHVKDKETASGGVILRPLH